MTDSYDLVIRNGTVFDGSGSDGFEADVAISGGKIARVGKVNGGARDEIDARGQIVTPGFLDLHSHLDGHVTWESRLYPVTGHGVTTVIIGNCGVGFAPCRPEDREDLIRLMQAVEDIAFEDLSKGLPWTWETYPDYIESLATRRFNMDVGTLVPHSPLRAYVMGERSLEGAATPEEQEQMASLVQRAVEAGALGVGSSTLHDQVTVDGRHIPSFHADEAEFTAIAGGMARAGTGLFQIAFEFNKFPSAYDELRMFARVGQASGRPITFSLKQSNSGPTGWRELLAISDELNEQGIEIHPQVLGRPTGAIMGLQTTLNPFAKCPSYASIAHLPVAERAQAMRSPELRAKLIAEFDGAQQQVSRRARGLSLLFPLGDPPNYEPEPSESVEAMAAERGIPGAELLYDLLLEKDGRNTLMLAGSNFTDYNLEPALEMLRNPHSVPGLGDAGAHSGIICDASATTSMLSYWTRDRTRGEKLPLPQVVKWMTHDCAKVLGLDDRGLIAEGKKADINVIDYDRLRLRQPRATNDLPAGGVRLVQDAEGYTATIVSGQIVHRDDQPTEALSGRVIRSFAAARREPVNAH